jgi:hypothetical protein
MGAGGRRLLLLPPPLLQLSSVSQCAGSRRQHSWSIDWRVHALQQLCIEGSSCRVAAAPMSECAWRCCRVHAL